MKFTAAANSARMEERPPTDFFISRRAAPLSLSAFPIGAHLFLLIAELRDGAIVNMTDGCATMGSEQTSERTTDEPRKSPDAADATARFRGGESGLVVSRGRGRRAGGLAEGVEREAARG
jgi:hypothetical protein